MSGFFGIPSPERWLGRLVKALIIGVKVFFGALAWEGFALVALSIGQSADKAGYFFLTGLGDAVGYFVAHVLVMHATCLQYGTNEYTAELHSGILLAVASGIVAGTLWGVWVLVFGPEYLALNFAEAFFFMLLLSFVFFAGTLMLLRWLNTTLLSPKSRFLVGDVHLRWKFDVSLAFSIAVADAFFLSTSASSFSDAGGLAVFNVDSSTAAGVALAYSGATALIGFLLAQLVQNSVLDYTFVDDVVPPPFMASKETMKRTETLVGGLSIHRGDPEEGGSRTPQETDQTNSSVLEEESPLILGKQR